MSDWISVSDRLPECPNYYLCCVIMPEHGGIFRRETVVLWYSGSSNKWECKEAIVTHWMPLPKTPEISLKEG